MCTRPSSAGCFLQAFDGLYEFYVIAVGGRRTEECGAVGLGEILVSSSVTDSASVEVAGLDFAGVWQGELVEKHGLQLFDGGEVEGSSPSSVLDGVADDGACGVLRLVSACGEGVVQFGQESVGDRDACLFHVCEDVE